MHGRGVILKIDLSSEKITREPISEELARKYVGGEALNTHLFWEHFLKVDPKIEPTSPDNVIIWGMGPLGATPYGAGSKSRWTFKGPAYGIFADSTSGGGFGCQMRWAGYDHMVITGRAKHPVYIWINNDEVQLRDASHLWGKKVGETNNAIVSELKDDKVDIASIGPAGENLVTYASMIVSNYRASGRTGAGCVLGSKNLKAIAVRGTKGISVNDRQAFLKAMDALVAALYKNKGGATPFDREYFIKYGTLGLVKPFNEYGWNSFRNSQGGQSPEADRLSGDWYVEHMQQRKVSCSPGCAAACQDWHYIRGDESPAAGKYASERGQRPEYGSINALGINCDIRDMPTAIHLAELCNQYGMDTIETGFTVSFIMELWQRGIINEQDMLKWTGEPMSLEWGDAEAVAKVLGYIAFQSNELGRVLKGGSYQAARRLEELKGMPVLQYVNYGKGGSPQGESMRSRPDLSFAAAVSSIGGHHLKGIGLDKESSLHYLGKPDAGDTWSYEMKGAGQAVSEDFTSMYNALGVCRFGGGGRKNIRDFPPELYAPAVYALTGMETTPEELRLAGERAVNLQKAFNSRLGLRREDDSVCHRWMNEPMTDGPGKGMKVSDFLEPAKDEYYEQHGWDKATSLQKRKKLEELGMGDVADVLAAESALAE